MTIHLPPIRLGTCLHGLGRRKAAVGTRGTPDELQLSRDIFGDPQLWLHFALCQPTILEWTHSGFAPPLSPIQAYLHYHLIIVIRRRSVERQGPRSSTHEAFRHVLNIVRSSPASRTPNTQCPLLLRLALDCLK